MLAMSHPGSFRIALLSEGPPAQLILGYIASPRSSIIGKLPSRGTPSTDTAADAGEAAGARNNWDRYADVPQPAALIQLDAGLA